LENCKSKCQTCGERPSHRTTDKRDELAPLHLAVPSALGPRLAQSLEPSTLPTGLRVGNATRSPSETDMARCRSRVKLRPRSAPELGPFFTRQQT
jgi:hypothetical protein